MYWKRSNPNCNGNRRDKEALRTTRIKNFKSKGIKIRRGCQYVGYCYYNGNLNWTAQNIRLGRGLDIAALERDLFTSWLIQPLISSSLVIFNIWVKKFENGKWIARFQKLPFGLMIGILCFAFNTCKPQITVCYLQCFPKRIKMAYSIMTNYTGFVQRIITT